MADESYLCIGEHATGFSFNEKNKTWSTAIFKEEKLIKKANIKTVEDLLSFMQKESLLKIKRIGNKSVFEKKLNKNEIVLLFYKTHPILYKGKLKISDLEIIEV